MTLALSSFTVSYIIASIIFVEGSSKSETLVSRYTNAIAGKASSATSPF